MRKKFRLVIILLFTCLIAFTLNTKSKAHAAASFSVEMVGGASIRFGEGGGFRFRCKLDEATVTELQSESTVYELHVYATLTTLYSETSSDFKKIDILIDPAKIYTDDDETVEEKTYYANACVINIKTNNRDKVYTAYAEVINKSDKSVAFRAKNAANNSLYNLLSRATVSTGEDYASQIFGDSSYNTWYGKEDKPIVVLSQAEYETVLSKKESGSIPEDAYIKIDGSTFSTFTQEEKLKAQADPYTAISNAIADIFSFGPGIETETVYVDKFTYTYGPQNTPVIIENSTIAFPVVSLNSENATKYTQIEVGDKNVLVPYIKVHEYNGYYYFPVFTRLSIADQAGQGEIGYSTSSLPDCITTNAEEVLNIFNKGGQVKDPYGTGILTDSNGNEVFCYTIKVPNGGYSQADLGLEKMLRCTYTTTIDNVEQSLVFFIMYTFQGEAYDDFQ